MFVTVLFQAWRRLSRYWTQAKAPIVHSVIGAISLSILIWFTLAHWQGPNLANDSPRIEAASSHFIENRFQLIETKLQNLAQWPSGANRQVTRSAMTQLVYLLADLQDHFTPPPVTKPQNQPDLIRSKRLIANKIDAMMNQLIETTTLLSISSRHFSLPSHRILASLETKFVTIRQLWQDQLKNRQTDKPKALVGQTWSANQRLSGLALASWLAILTIWFMIKQHQQSRILRARMELRRRLKANRQEYQKLAEYCEDLQQENQQAQKAATQLTEKLRQSQSQLEAMATYQDELTDQIDQCQKALQAVNADHQRLKTITTMQAGDLACLQQQVTRYRHDNKRLQNEVDVTAQNHRQLQTRMHQVEQTLEPDNKRLLSLFGLLDETQTQTQTSEPAWSRLTDRLKILGLNLKIEAKQIDPIRPEHGIRAIANELGELVSHFRLAEKTVKQARCDLDHVKN